MNTKKKFTDQGHLLLFFCSCILILLFGRLYNNLQPYLVQTEQQYKSGKALNLEPGVDAGALRSILTVGNYYADTKDINLIADSLSSKLAFAGKLANLGALNKQSFFIKAPLRWQNKTGGADFQDRFHASLIRLGFDSALYTQESVAPMALPSAVTGGKGNASLSGTVRINDDPASSVLIQLKQHIAVTGEDTTEELLTYARTNAEGRFEFNGLATDSAYSVLPLKPGYEFGTRKGTTRLTGSPAYTFHGQMHRIRLIGSVAYGQMKDDRVLTVRTPASFRSLFWMIAAGFIVSFWAVHLFWRLRKFPADTFLLPVLMMLTGISLITLLSIQDALQDTFHAGQALQGIVFGLVGLAIFSQVNFGKIYASWWFDWLFNFRKRSFYNLQGWTWLSLAILMAILTLVAGTGPEGSGVKVNLQFGGLSFQPSEITKYLLLLFFAAFFAANEQHLRNYQDIRWRFITSWTVMAGAGVILVLYLLMGDMGPALVVCITFLVFYSLARGNLAITVIAGVIYGVLLWFLPDWIATVISFAGVLLYLFFKGHIKSSTWYGWTASLVEAPVLLLLIIAAFTFGDRLPGIGDRLADRKNMWLSQWNNDIYGGDHLAHGYWTLSSGGLSGQGLGKGFANTMPAAHTDMILPAIGEELGWLGLVAVFLLFAILIHRIFLHAKRAGQPFSFYLCAGIAIATGVQFLLIAAGSIGLLPLTGVTVPFLSYGKISLIINLAAMGIIASVSARPGKEIQKEYIRQYYDPVLLTGIAGFLAGTLLLAGKLAWIQLWSGKEYIVKAARVIDRNGSPVFSYNPRINELAKILGAGMLYDRNGRVLATSDINEMKKNIDSLSSAGLAARDLNELMRKKLRRYYPFGEQLFFWVGDFNSRLFWNQGNGYFAEAEHLSTLRGFDTKPSKVQYFTSRYKADRFTKPVSKEVELVAYDYSPLATMLRTGIDSSNAEVKKLKEKNRDVQLTVDAKLQTLLQKKLANSDFKNRRISVVVMDAASGDLLASAIHPLPDLQSPEKMLLSEKERLLLGAVVTERDIGMTYPTAPGSTAKIVTGMAAIKKLGPSAVNITYDSISRDEILRNDDREPEPYGRTIDMRQAIVKSSNIYFIRLANDEELDNELSDFYLTTGMNVHQLGGYSYYEDSTGNNEQRRRQIARFWKDSVFSINRNFYTDKRRQGTRTKYYGEFSGLAWGQGQLTATPASMARMAGIIANKGIFRPSRYVLKKEGIEQPLNPGVTMVVDAGAGSLQEFMIEQSNPGGKQKIEGIKVAGKTGTPQRTITDPKKSRSQRVNKITIRDGWYVFYTPAPGKKSHTIVCIRIEQGDRSANAVALANKEIAPVLKEMGYIDSF
jgi:cell division protein FtsW (lipid II flippase)